MEYAREFIPEHEIPRTEVPLLQHVVDTPPASAYPEGVIALARARLPALAAADEKFWLTRVP